MLKDAKKVLKEYRSRGCMTLEQVSVIFRNTSVDAREAVLYLYRLQYLWIESNYAILHDMEPGDPIAPDTPLVITMDGKAALEETEDFEKYRRYNEFRAWITLAVALLAFAKSFFF